MEKPTVVYYPTPAEGETTREARAEAFARLGRLDPIWSAFMHLLQERLANAMVAAVDRDPNAPGRIEELLGLQQDLAALRAAKPAHKAKVPSK